MASIFNALHIGYTGLNAAQVGIDTSGHNIANAETDGYTRQRVVSTAATPIYSNPGNVGNGVEIQTVKRVFDNYVFDRYTDIYAQKEYTDFEKNNLEQLSAYFPEIDNVGIKTDLQEYYNMWQSFADNPDNEAIKIALTKQTEILSDHINATQTQVKDLQLELNNQLETNVKEVNSLAKELADLNRSIDTAESGDLYDANDLRDKRNVIERDLARLIGSDVNSGQLKSNIQIDSSSNTKTGSYSLSVNGFNIVDGATFHPIHITNEKNSFGFYEISYERQDGVLIPLEETVNDGKIGAILDLRGGRIDSQSGVPSDGIFQNTVSQLDAFAKSLIESTNNMYAQNSQTRMDSNVLEFPTQSPLTSGAFNIKEGSFNVHVYDIDGNLAATRTINIDNITTMTGLKGTNSIEGQINAQSDDNNDGNANNDIDDFVHFKWATYPSGEHSVEFTMNALSADQGYTFAIEDNLKDSSISSGTNFAGALGLNRFFDGDSASNISLSSQLRNDPSSASAGYTKLAGDSSLALDIVQQQFEELSFDSGRAEYDATIYDMFDVISTEVGIATNAAISRSETINTQFNAVEMEYASVSKVSIDEELTNLIKYQTSYGAAAKVITTIDQMMQTLLGIKQ